MKLEEYPENGLTYKEAKELWDCTMKEAIRKLNNLFNGLKLIPGEMRGGYRIFKKESQEIILFGDETRHHRVGHCEGAAGTIALCGWEPCSKEFRKRNKTMRFCSTPCATKQYAKEGDERNMARLQPRKCPGCGLEFAPKAKRQRYCSIRCRCVRAALKDK